MNQLTQKETMLLKDLKSHEELCIKKYSKSANESSDQQLKQLFTELGQQEQIHLNTINQIMGGQVPNVNQGQGQQQNMQAQGQNQQSQMSGQTQNMWANSTQQSQNTQQTKNPFVTRPQNQQMQNQQTQTMQNQSSGNQADYDLCYDLLSTEKHVSSTYNTAIFEFNDANVRNVLNHIQKEEQEHGYKIYSYLKQHNAYQVQA